MFKKFHLNTFRLLYQSREEHSVNSCFRQASKLDRFSNNQQIVYEHERSNLLE